MESNKNISALCEQKEKELLLTYFGRLADEAANERPEEIGLYTRDLPLKVEAEYRAYLEELWALHASAHLKGQPLVLEEQKLRALITEDDREAVDSAYEAATTRTLWERLTSTNYKDVVSYKDALMQYTRELLLIMRLDFLEEITGRHILGKAFEEQE